MFNDHRIVQQRYSGRQHTTLDQQNTPKKTLYIWNIFDNDAINIYQWQRTIIKIGIALD